MTAVRQDSRTDLPHWDMTPVFPSLNSPEFEADCAQATRELDELRALFDRHGVRASSGPADSGAFDEVLQRLSSLLDHLRTLRGYIMSFVATDSRNAEAQARMSELQIQGVEVSKLVTRFEAWVGSFDVDALVGASPAAAAHEFALRKAALASMHQMSEPEEDLAATLSPSGAAAWGKLHGDITSRLQVRVVEPDGNESMLPMSEVRGRAHDPDPGVRQAAYEAEIAGWESVSVPLAAAMNGVKGTRGVLDDRRGWTDSLAPALFANNVDAGTLHAMQTACVESFPDMRRYFKAKARLLGKDSLAWWDLFAPLAGASGPRQWDWPEAEQFVVEQFATYSDRLAGLARRSFEERWVDAEPRLGKRDGAFCMGLRSDESRVMMNFTHSFGSVSTLAHELGHAYHNLNLADRTPLQRQTPMALAETASIFCQTIVMNAMLEQSQGAEKVAILEAELQHATQLVVDIHSRFLFERDVFGQRRRRELSVDEFNGVMLEAQRATYGDGLDPQAMHPWMWAMKPHYYGSSFYNWPYTFGFLFGLGLYAQYLSDPDGFRAGYDDLLSSTGLHDAATLGARFGIDIRSVDFWRASLDQVRERVSEFEALSSPAQ
ncbi:MAG TPA: M3 family oligoendopeptidase [Actinomycetota bacterium]|nr:M3 family oligoendopeptidase [Actinomycetota bacterium]